VGKGDGGGGGVCSWRRVDKPRHSTDLVELRSPILWSLYILSEHIITPTPDGTFLAI
jgi:hypothetical protein